MKKLKSTLMFFFQLAIILGVVEIFRKYYPMRKLFLPTSPAELSNADELSFKDFINELEAGSFKTAGNVPIKSLFKNCKNFDHQETSSLTDLRSFRFNSIHISDPQEIDTENLVLLDEESFRMGYGAGFFPYYLSGKLMMLHQPSEDNIPSKGIVVKTYWRTLIINSYLCRSTLVKIEGPQ